MGSAHQLPSATAAAQGAGLIDVSAASAAATPNAVQTWERSTGLGSIEKARGSHHVTHNGQTLSGEQDFTGRKWSATAFAQALRTVTTDGSLQGLSWSGLSWSGLSWSGLSWSGISWS